jgi:predicted dehydrogenase
MRDPDFAECWSERQHEGHRMKENIAIQTLGRRLRLGIVGGAGHSLVGPVHREAARFDDLFSLDAAVLSSNPQKGNAAAIALGIPRSYETTAEMFSVERARPDGIEAVAIATPNDSHYRLLCEALDAGLHVICDKPLTSTMAEAEDVLHRAKIAGKVMVLTHNYSGYAMVRQARAMVEAGDLGTIHQVHGLYALGQMGRLFEADEDGIPPSMKWRIDPSRGGESHALVDIGTHVHHLVTYITKLQIAEVMADLGPAVAGRTAHDSANIIFRLENGAFGSIWATKAASGASKLEIEAYGDKGGLLWEQADANNLLHLRQGFPPALIGRQVAGLYPPAIRAMRGPGFHFVEGYREAFANLYVDFAEQILAGMGMKAPDPLAWEAPSVVDGLRSMAFIDACLASSRDRQWRVVERLG